MTPDQFEDFYIHYCQHPEPQRLEEALASFVQSAPDAASDKTGLAGQARFFAVLAASHPKLLRKAETLFEQSDWAHKTVLLEVFRRVEDERLAAKLAAWSKLEGNDDRRILLEQVRIKTAPGLAVLEQPAQDPDVLAEQWACFFALGNTQPANAVFELLAGSGGAAAPSGTTATAAPLSVMPADRADLIETAWADLERYARQHPIIGKLAAEELFRDRPESYRARLAGLLASQALELRSAASGRMLAPMLEKLWAPKPRELKFFMGALAVLEGRDDAAANCRSWLLAEQPVLAERLSGYQAWFKSLNTRSAWHAGPPQADAQALALKCGEALAACQGFRTYAVLKTHCYQPGRRSDDRVCHLATLFLNPDVGFVWQNAGRREEAWRQNAGRIFLWNQGSGTWTPVHSRSLRNQIQKLSGAESLAQILSQARPESLAPVPAAGGDLWQLRFTLPDVQDLIDPRWEAGLQPESRPGTLKVYVDAGSRQVLYTQLFYAAACGDTPSARFSLDRIYYDYAAPDLARWREMK